MQIRRFFTVAFLTLLGLNSDVALAGLSCPGYSSLFSVKSFKQQRDVILKSPKTIASEIKTWPQVFQGQKANPKLIQAVGRPDPGRLPKGKGASSMNDIIDVEIVFRPFDIKEDSKDYTMVVKSFSKLWGFHKGFDFPKGQVTNSSERPPVAFNLSTVTVDAVTALQTAKDFAKIMKADKRRKVHVQNRFKRCHFGNGFYSVSLSYVTSGPNINGPFYYFALEEKTLSKPLNERVGIGVGATNALDIIYKASSKTSMYKADPGNFKEQTKQVKKALDRLGIY